MDAPDKIYVNPDLDCLWTDECPGDVEYIRKDALLECAKEKHEEYDRRIAGFPDDGAYWGQRNAFRQMIDKLNSM